MDLKDLRQEIDQIDNQLLPLFLKRMELSKQVAAYKAQNNLPILNQEREDEILQEVEKKAGEFAFPSRIVFSTLMDVSRALQHQMLGAGDTLRSQLENTPRTEELQADRIACQGVKGAYSGIAGKKLFPHAELSFYEKFEDVFAAVQKGEVEYGVIPIENSYAGSVHESYDLMMKYQLYIAAGIDLPVSHKLLGLPGADLKNIKEVYSHPQALAQCNEYLRENGLIAHPYLNTAAAAEMVSNAGDPALAAISSADAAKLYGLSILDDNISVSDTNTTRFIAISKKLVISEQADKISLIFALPHTTGSLYRTLARFSICGLNLTKIESRPIVNKNFNYRFYLDFTGNAFNSSTLDLLCALSDELPQFSFLGNYKEFTQI